MELEPDEWLHPLEGDGCIPILYQYIWRRRIHSIDSSHDIRIPSTVVFSHNFPKEWYMMSRKTGDVERRVGQDITNKAIIKDFCSGHRYEGSDGYIVAFYMSEVKSANGTSQTTVEFMDRKLLEVFLTQRADRGDGFLQKFIQPDGKHNVVIQATWTPIPAIQMVDKRANILSINDRRHPLYDRGVTYEGPPHYSREAFIAPHIQWQVKRQCREFVDHILFTDHVRVQRMVLYFKVDADSDLWLLWCGSMRISTVGKERPVNLGVEYIAKKAPPQESQEDAWEALSLLDGSRPSYGTRDEEAELLRRMEEQRNISPTALRFRPPSLGPLDSIFSTCIGHDARLRARKRFLRRVEEAHAQTVKLIEEAAVHGTAEGTACDRQSLSRSSIDSHSRHLTPRPPSQLSVSSRPTPVSCFSESRGRTSMASSQKQGMKLASSPRPLRKARKRTPLPLITFDMAELQINFAPPRMLGARHYWRLCKAAVACGLLGSMAKGEMLRVWASDACSVVALGQAADRPKIDLHLQRRMTPLIKERVAHLLEQSGYIVEQGEVGSAARPPGLAADDEPLERLTFTLRGNDVNLITTKIQEAVEEVVSSGHEAKMREYHAISTAMKEAWLTPQHM